MNTPYVQQVQRMAVATEHVDASSAVLAQVVYAVRVVVAAFDATAQGRS